MILPFSGRSCCSTLAFTAILFALLSLAAANSTTSTPSIVASNCSAEITVNSTEYSPHFFIYHDIIVENTGLCELSKVFVNITLPPEETVFLYYNVSNSTGELFGIYSPIPQGRVEIGGTIVMNSARLPVIVLDKLECSSVCNAASPSPVIPPSGSTPSTELPSDPSSPPPSETPPAEAPPAEAPPAETPAVDAIQVELKQGSNAFWFALSVLSGGEIAGPRDVMFLDSSADASWMRMESANWGETPTFTHSPTNGPLVLPISLEITLASGVSILRDVITSFSADTYSSSQATQVNQDIDA